MTWRVCCQVPREKRTVFIRVAQEDSLEWSGAASLPSLPRIFFWHLQAWALGGVGDGQGEGGGTLQAWFLHNMWEVECCREVERKAGRGRGRSRSRMGIQNKLRTFEIWRGDVNPCSQLPEIWFAAERVGLFKTLFFYSASGISLWVTLFSVWGGFFESSWEFS